MKKIFLISILIAFIFYISLASADINDGYGCGPWGMMGGYGNSGFGFAFSLLFWIVIFIALILLVAWLIKQLKNEPRKRR